MKMLLKMLLVLVISINMLAIIPSAKVEAADTLNGLNPTQSAAPQEFKNVVGKILGFLQVASGLAAVIMIAVTGFNYIISTPEVKKEMLSKMLPIVVGLILVFGAVSITKFLLGVTVTSSIQSGGGTGPAVQKPMIQ